MGLLLDLPPVEPGQSPLLPQIYIPRVGLWERLDASTRSGVTVVVAPPGAGKTLGVAGWVRSEPSRQGTVWLNAHRADDLDRLRQVLASADPTAGSLANTGLPPLVVVDDAHLLPPSVLARVDEVLVRCPTGVRLVLLARWDLPLDLLLPELLGTLTVLRGDALKLDPADASTLVRAHARTRSAVVVDAITSRAQGWCAALVLAARAAAAATDELAFAEKYRSAGCSVDDLVASEVFAALSSRERHLLLCTAGEDEVTADLAQRLTGDVRAPEVLVSLESTGLLVSRETTGPASGSGYEPEDVRFHIHPLLREVARRRLVAGGVDVEQAKATVRRCVTSDLSRGEVASGFARMIFLQQHDHAVDLFAGHSIALALGPARSEVANLARCGADVVDDHPEWWLAVALERRLAGDTKAYRHWLGRIVDQPGHELDPDGLRRRCVARLALARIGLAAPGPTLEEARDLGDARRTDALQAVLDLELGATESWAGELEAGASDLTSAVVVARAHALGLLVVAALSHLAATLLAQGKSHAARVVAQEALALGVDEPQAFREAHERARMVVELAGLQTDPWAALSGAVDALPPLKDRPYLDPTDAVWQRSIDVQRLVGRGALAEAQRLLECPLAVPPLPRHLELVLLTARARLAFLLRDSRRLLSAASSFTRLDDPCSALWATAAAAEVDDHRGQARELYTRAAATTSVDPAGTRQLCRVSAAQLLDQEGCADEADQLLAEALLLSESARDATPFLGWSLRGVDMTVLFERAARHRRSAWLSDLQAAAATFPGLHVHFTQSHLSPHELAQAADVVVRPVLSHREREVLNELARGATYADVAANLFVSENTVKTHVSSLYGKLGVGRRSGALAVARKLNLL